MPDMTELQRRTWECYLHAKINAGYYRRLALRLRRRLFGFEIGIWLCSSGSVLGWINENKSPLVPFLTIAGGFLLVVTQKLNLVQRIVLLDTSVRQWDRQSKDWNMLWMRMHEEPGGVLLSDFQRLRSYDPTDLEGEIGLSKSFLKQAKLEAEASEHLEGEGQHDT